MTRKQAADRIKAELAHWQSEVDEPVSIEALDEIEQALVDACQACKDEVVEDD